MVALLSPVSLSEFAASMAHISLYEKNPQLAVAVSGGADSMALLLLAHQWAQNYNGTITALTVDHGLRAESKSEALQVQKWCKKFGIKHHILTWSPPEINSAVQAQARAARYTLLTEWCHQNHILHLLTAHHIGDQAETLLLRTARGSGIDGLACMSMNSQMHGIRLLRPLLHMPKSRLLATLKNSGQEWCEDPTNQNLNYTRNHIRSLMDNAPESEMLAMRASQLASSFGNIRNLLENKLASCMTNAVSIFPGGYGFIEKEAFFALPAEYALRAITALISALNSEFDPPRSEKLQRFYDELSAGKISRRSFAGLLFYYQPKKKCFAVYREPKALQGAIIFSAQTPAMWDRRFEVEWDGKLPAAGKLAVRALGRDGIARLKMRKLPVEKAIIQAFPAFWHLEELIAVPHINYLNPAYANITCKARFHPAKALAGKAFFSMNRTDIN